MLLGFVLGLFICAHAAVWVAGALMLARIQEDSFHFLDGSGNFKPLSPDASIEPNTDPRLKPATVEVVNARTVF